MKIQFVGPHLDFVGFSTSMLCAIHCAILPFLLTLTPLAGLQFLENHWIEYAIIFLSFVIASLALIHGYRKHHRKPMALIIVSIGFMLIGAGQWSHSESTEAILTTFGGLTIAIAHVVNWKSIKMCAVKYPDCSNRE
jgi:hypothetical protein